MSWLVRNAGYKLTTASFGFLRLLVRDGAIDLLDLKGMRKANVLAADCGAGDLVFDYSAVAAFRCLGNKGVRPSSLSASLLSVG
jgi:hypothetical protein